MRRVLTGIAATVLLLVLGTVILGYQLLRGEQGSVLGGAVLSRLLPGLSLGGLQGSLTQGHARLIGWHQDGLEIYLREVDWEIALDCDPTERLCFGMLNAASMEIRQPPEDMGEALPLAPVALPVAVELRSAAIGSLILRKGAVDALRTGALRFAATLEGTALGIHRFDGGIDDWKASATGRIELRDRLPLFLQARLKRGTDYAAAFNARGDLRRLSLRGNIEAPLALDVDGWIEPLGEDLPLEFELRPAGALSMPAPVERLGKLEDASLRLRGSIHALQASVEGTLDSTVLGRNRLRASAALGTDRLVIEDARLEGEAGTVSATGDVALDGDRAWALALAVQSLHAPGIAATLDARLDGTARLAGALDADPVLDSATLDLHGLVNGLPAALRGNVVLEAGQGLRFDAFEIASGPNRLRLGGIAGDALTLDGELLVEDLSATLRGAGGRGKGHVTVRGSPGSPQLAATVELAQPAWDGWSANSLRVQLQGDAHSTRVDGELRGEDLDLSLQCAGESAAGNNWQIRCNRLEARAGAAVWTLDAPLSLAASPDAVQAEPFCLHAAESSVCSTQRLVIDGQGWRGLAVEGRALSLDSLSGLLPADAALSGSAELQASASMPRGGALSLDAKVQAAGIALEFPAAGQPVQLRLRDSTVTLGVDAQGTRVAAQARLGDDGRLDASMQLKGRDPDAALTGAIDLSKIDLAPLVPRTPGLLEARGTLDGHIGIEGTVGSPRLSGEVHLASGLLAHERLPEPVQDIVLRLNFDGPRAGIDGRFTTAAGTARLSGDAHWNESDWSADLQLDADRLRIEPLRGSTATLSPALRIVLGPARAVVSGTVDVPEASIDIATVPKDAASVSPDAIEEGAPPPEAQFDYRLDLNLRLGEAVQFRGFGAEARLGGALRVRRAPGGSFNGNGEISILDGRYSAWGQRLEVTDGRLLFRGPLDQPGLQIEAIRRIEDEPVTVGVRVRGTAREPELSVFSRPAMPESRALHYLLTGRAPATGETAGLGAAGALISIGASGASRITGGALEKLGIEDFAIDTRSVEGGTEVMISGYITPDLYLRYGVSTFDEVNTFRMRYRLTPKFFVEAISGIENAVDFLYSFQR